MFKKILIANRGEIALRIIRTCKELGIKTVAVYSEADRDSLHVIFADEAVCIGPSSSKDSYLKIANIMSAAQITGAEAIHPGYGFLAENADFSEICSDSGIKFIGPSPDMINRMGDKALAKATMSKVGVPVVPGSDGAVHSVDEAKRIAAEIGYPVMLKASAGGGGKGMRIVGSEDLLEKAYQTASSEAEASFGNPELYLEKFIENPRHVEIQVMGDQKGNVYHYYERDCSIQRRHQKLIEEAPSAFITEEVRNKMGEAAVLGASSVNYEGAGTIEFLVDKYMNFYFIEMNTRIQVEHPVTEMVQNLDLIKQQILVAAGLEVENKPRKPVGHSFEFRINAEDPDFNFRPSPGRIEYLHFPGGFGVRIDSHVYNDYVIPPFYDSLIAKLIVWGTDRQHAIARAKRAFEEFSIEGIKTTVPFHMKVLENEDFINSNYDTSFIDKLLKK
ncbi:MAG: acetyl-CoA carboxylase biotin carboxylase subunit [Melioribacteraceae bacterium]|nr:acetyl-CoA carboxylase biotin carboxylase subunit [Melioribacteraceae bacterium]MCF8353081.1 acetyl-CoA carboxylase biotin carboxylase subunit [Melioribacteraceae bacterium]MCF8392773.1 acetyl-CoA carboxylase biotin carboxylase subunit [Melioribacteraceae bacterium]MCF8418304.1 acetyl-CoA carboxylase biotin carboxylase subunit [Melioribacteraceae bacterium]